MGKKFCFLLITLTLSGCYQKPKVEETFVVPDVEITTHNYYEVSDHAISWGNIFSVGLPNYYIYFYSPTCSHCADLKNWIIATALEQGDIYFIKASENDVIKNNITNSIGASDTSEVSILGYPSLIEIVNGVITKNVAGKTAIQSLLK